PSHQLSPSDCPFTSGIPITFPPCIRYSRQSAPLHSKYPFLSYFPIRVPFFHHIPHHTCPLTLNVPISVPLNIKCAHQRAP
ncbi:unnamed protein product, partial [Staurois parvus]